MSRVAAKVVCGLVGAAALSFASCSSAPDRPPASVGSVPDGGGMAEGGGADAPTGPQTTGSIVSAASFSNWEAETQIAVAPSGDLFVVWIALDLGGQRSIGYALSHDGGASWSAPHVVPATAGVVAVDPSVVVDGKGVFHVTWLELPAGAPRRVMGAAYEPTGDVFTIPVEISDPSTPGVWDKPTLAALADGSLLVAFGTENGASLVVAKSTDGKSWSRKTLAPDGTPRNVAFACASGARAYIASLVPNGVELVRSADSGATWSAPIRVDAPTPAVAFEPPSCVASGSDVWVAYGTGGGGGSETQTPLLDDLWVARSSDGGATIAERSRASEPGQALHYLLPMLGRDDSGKLALAYYAGASAGAQGSLRIAFSSDGSAWSTRAVVESPILVSTKRDGFDWLGDYVGVALRGGNAFLSFADNQAVPGASTSRIRVARIAVR